MCLNVCGSKLVRVKAPNDIKCYKVMGIKKDGKLITPYIHFPMEKGKIYEDKENENIKYGCVISDKLNRIRLNKDVIYHVYPCIIPSGSEYINGNYYNHEPVFASKKLMILDD